MFLDWRSTSRIARRTAEDAPLDGNNLQRGAENAIEDVNRFPKLVVSRLSKFRVVEHSVSDQAFENQLRCCR